jgi:hypothetical protein
VAVVEGDLPGEDGEAGGTETALGPFPVEESALEVPALLGLGILTPTAGAAPGGFVRRRQEVERDTEG